MLAKEVDTDEQVILMAKGIGFGRKAGQQFTPDNDRQIFKMWSENTQIKLITYSKEKLAEIIGDLCTTAHNQLGIEKDTLEKTLTDHIVFAIDRLNFGLDMEYPFFGEVSVLYATEFELGKYMMYRIRSEMGLDLHESEAGYIAMHIHAQQSQNPVQITMEQLKMYSLITATLKPHIHRTNLLLLIIEDILANRTNTMSMPFKYIVFENMPKSKELAMQVFKIIKDEQKIELSEDQIAFLTVEIERVYQQQNNKE